MSAVSDARKTVCVVRRRWTGNGASVPDATPLGSSISQRFNTLNVNCLGTDRLGGLGGRRDGGEAAQRSAAVLAEQIRLLAKVRSRVRIPSSALCKAPAQPPFRGRVAGCGCVAVPMVCPWFAHGRRTVRGCLDHCDNAALTRGSCVSISVWTRRVVVKRWGDQDRPRLATPRHRRALRRRSALASGGSAGPAATRPCQSRRW